MTDARRLAEAFARELKAKHGDWIERVILFGSVARGDHGPHSDVDLLIIARRDSLALQDEVAGAAVDLLLRTGVYVSAKVFLREEMDRVRETLFGRAVTAEGIVIG